MTTRDSIERLQWEIQQCNQEINRLRAECSHQNYRTLESEDIKNTIGYHTYECLDCLYRWREVHQWL